MSSTYRFRVEPAGAVTPVTDPSPLALIRRDATTQLFLFPIYFILTLDTDYAIINIMKKISFVSLFIPSFLLEREQLHLLV